MPLFITFEGIDGSGKDTQLESLCRHFKAEDKYNEIVLARQNSNRTKAGIKIVNFLENSNPNKLSAFQTANLYVDDRIELSNQYRVFLRWGYNVFVSRYDLSTLAYQQTQGEEFDILYALHQYEARKGTLIPDITLLFDLPAEVALDRRKIRGDKEEYFEKRDFQKKLRNIYLESAKKIQELQPERKVIVVNADQSPEDVTNEMIYKLEPYL